MGNKQCVRAGRASSTKPPPLHFTAALKTLQLNLRCKTIFANKFFMELLYFFFLLRTFQL